MPMTIIFIMMLDYGEITDDTGRGGDGKGIAET
jgi:hypothetical protein